jgi:hypothetical protein
VSKGGDDEGAGTYVSGSDKVGHASTAEFVRQERDERHPSSPNPRREGQQDHDGHDLSFEEEDTCQEGQESGGNLCDWEINPCGEGGAACERGERSARALTAMAHIPLFVANLPFRPERRAHMVCVCVCVCVCVRVWHIHIRT